MKNYSELDLNKVIGWRLEEDNDPENCSSYMKDNYRYYAMYTDGTEDWIDFDVVGWDAIEQKIYDEYFGPKSIKDRLIEWTRNYLNSFGGNTKAVVGISGGKDSTIVLKLLIEAIGRARVYAITMPHKEDGIAPEVLQISKEFNMPIDVVSVEDAYKNLTDKISLRTPIIKDGIICTNIHAPECDANSNSVYKSNTPCRLRMVTLYGIAALLGDARVVCTSNRSEDYIGWATKWGDMAGDFAPLANLTVREVKQLGYELGISENLIEKKPDDGMCGATDEEKFGFTYDELDDYLLGEGSGQPLMKLEHLEKIQKMHKVSRHKFDEMPKFVK